MAYIKELMLYIMVGEATVIGIVLTIGEFFQRSDVQELMAKPITDQASNLKVAQMEFDYWKSVKDNPNSSASDKIGAEIALKFSPEVRAQLQEKFVKGENLSAYKLIFDTYPRIFKDFLNNVEDNFINDLQNLFNQAQTITSPIILDLDGNGVDTISKSAGIHFDLDGNKFAETTGWVGKNDGLLVLDKNGNGKIDNGTELFGNNTLLKNGTKAANGFVALAELDNNKDGKIDASDTAYNQLRVWKDSNSNGLADTGELLTLTQAGVKSLNTGYTNQTQTDAQGNQHLQVGNYTRTDGSTRAMNDVWFATDNARTIDQDIVTVNATIAALPELQGFGNVRSLQQAMARDTSGRLQTLVQNFIRETNVAARDTIMTTLLYTWVGVENNNPNGRDPSKVYGHLIDARKVEVLEAFMGQSFKGTWCWGEKDPNPHGQSAPILEAMFGKLAQFMKNQLLAQTQFKSLYNSINLSWNSTTNQFDIDVSATVTALQTKYTADATAGAALILDFGNNLRTTGDFGQQVLATLQKQGNIAGQGFAFSLATMGYNTINGTANNDTLNGINGKDNWLVGNGGNDNISGGNGNDIINGGLGDDNISGGNGNDLINGGAGNDNLNGDYGNDIYIFNKGDGQDTISDYDPTSGNTDTIRFGTDINPTDITLTRDLYNLYLSYSTTDKITVQNWGYGTAYQIEKVEFANGTSWDSAKLLTAPFMGTASADYFSGTDGNDIFYGLAGNDNISGGNGNDIINGGLGDDNISGGNGNDIIDGGIGKDTLIGGLGTDRFDYYNLTDSLLSGFDIITDFNATTGNDLFRVSTARAGFVNVGAVNSLSAADIGAKLTAAAFKSNFAAQFSFGQKTFVAINNATAGFNAANDAIIEVTGLTGTLNVNNFVIV
jgi:Ca2+-binding RTX toxin-like protein